MTPEERSKDFLDGIDFDCCKEDVDNLVAVLRNVVLEEREACAKYVENEGKDDEHEEWLKQIAMSIRSRS